MKITCLNGPCKYRHPSMRQMLAMDAQIEVLKKSGKPLQVLEGVRTIEFKKNRSKQNGIFCYPNKDSNIIKEIFEITHGKILSVTYWNKPEKIEGEDSESSVVEFEE